MIQRFPKRGRRWHLGPAYVSSLYHGFRQRDLFSAVERYCMFIGYPHSGHSLVGSLLDAHPNVVVAHELDALAFLQARFSRNQIYALILNNAQKVALKGRQQTGYSYFVPGAWNGRFESLRVIGDKSGGKSTDRFRRHPELLQRMLRDLGREVAFIHIVRNPYDNITTMAKRQRRPLERSIERYFSLCDEIVHLKRSVGKQVIDLKHESVIHDPEASLSDLCRFLGLDAPGHYLEKSSSIVFRAARKTRRDVPWSPYFIDLVEQRILNYGFLEGYSWED